MWKTLQEHPIRAFALLFAAALLGFIAYMIVWFTDIMSSSEWCGKALQAERISTQGFGGLTACVDLLKIQLQSLADVLKISMGSFAFGLIVIVVVVLAGARAVGKVPGGMEVDIGPSDGAAAGAKQVAQAAVDEAQAVAQDAKVATPPNPDYNGPAMPEPGKDT